MTSKTQLQSKIQKLEKVGDVLEDGSIVLQKENNLTLLVAPTSAQVECTWSPEFPEVFSKLKEQGFNPSQWFVPTKEQLKLAYKTIPEHFSSTNCWSSTELNVFVAWSLCFGNGIAYGYTKKSTLCVRAFRRVSTKTEKSNIIPEENKND